MEIINRSMTNICSEDLNACKRFYTSLFDFKVNFKSDWYIQLISEANNFELGIIDRENQLIPNEFKDNPRGFYLTFVVKDVDELYKQTVKKDIHIVEKPNDTFYGQRRLLIKDPAGTLIDVSTPIQSN